MFHVYNHTKTINSKQHKHIMHTYSHVSYFKLEKSTESYNQSSNTMKWTALKHASVSLKLWPSLKQKRPFTQAIGSRLGETVIRKHCKFREPSLGRDLLA